MIKIYGIKNCNSMKKAFDWLDAHGISYAFHDYKKLGIDHDTIRGWCTEASWQKLLNTQGTTWRGLDAAEKENVDAEKAIALMVAKPSLIKRPVITGGKHFVVGFDETNLRNAFED